MFFETPRTLSTQSFLFCMKNCMIKKLCVLCVLRGEKRIGELEKLESRFF